MLVRARLFHVPQFAPDEKEAEDEGTRDTSAKRKSGALTHAGHWQRKKKKDRTSHGEGERKIVVNTRRSNASKQSFNKVSSWKLKSAK